MYFNDNRKDTNIDSEFKDNKNNLSNILNLLNKYKLFIIIGVALLLIIIMIVLFANRKPTKVESFLELLGEETINIYQGNDYIEPGYNAYNSKKEDLTSKVNITSNLNINIIGSYEITYTLDDITKTRKINVIEKNKEYTYIKLNAINKDINIYLKLGDKYVDPGYQVFNSEGKDLNNLVKVTGTVDTNKKGTYKIVYSLVDTNNVTISKARIVTVMDSEISLSLKDSSYTNGNAVINVHVADEFFDYMILPNNEKITTSTYSYEVSNNGKYTFTTYNSKGMKKESSIEVKNIDRTVPTGSCSGYYKEKSSTINIKASDNIGISKYVLNGTSYTSNNITINKKMTSVNITIYDKAGNTKNISCNLENKIEQTIEPTEPVTPPQQPQQPANPLDSIYTESNSHTSSINGIKYLLYNQTDSRWGDVKYPKGTTTIGQIGCMITAVATVASAYNETITPKTVFDKQRHEYPYRAINTLVDDGFDCKQISATNSSNKILTALSSGKAVVIMVKGKYSGGTSKFTSSQHYMALIDYKDGKIFVGNSYSKYGYGKSGWYDQDKVLTSVKEVNICTPTNKLIERFK